VSEWQPIETAPKDGTGFIGRRVRGDVVTCWWQTEFEAFISSCRVMELAAGYSFEDGKSEKLHSPVIERVTHWMPLPAPPSD
jgi:hypothetical protein